MSTQIIDKNEIEQNDDEMDIVYKNNIPTIRSATHRVRYSNRKTQAGNPSKPNHKILDANTRFQMPEHLRTEFVLDYNAQIYNLREAVCKLLKAGDTSLLGKVTKSGLETLEIPPSSLLQKSVKQAQQTLSDSVVNSIEFLNLFDSLLLEVVLPDLKKRIGTSLPTTFWYQRPPTLRLQPGPSRARVKPHADCEYGHQDGELNYWMPLTDSKLTQTCLWAESEPGAGDFHPLESKVGQMNVFFGSYCKHYVPPNSTIYTRVSLDFRVGIPQYGFDPDWQMLGTTNDHTRRSVTL